MGKTELLIAQHHKRRLESQTKNPCGEVSLNDDPLDTVLQVISMQIEANMITVDEARKYAGFEPGFMFPKDAGDE